MRSQLGTPKECSKCGFTSEAKLKFDWANISGDYKKDLTDWIRLCRPCHYRMDRNFDVPRNFCTKGHELVGKNLYIKPSRNERECWTCKRALERAYEATGKRKAEKKGPYATKRKPQV